jgi:hypothetical protein
MEKRMCTLMNMLNINERVDEGAFDANKKNKENTSCYS